MTQTVFKNIVVREETYATLRSLGKMSDSYDSVIKRLIERSGTKKEYERRNKILKTVKVGLGNPPAPTERRNHELLPESGI